MAVTYIQQRSEFDPRAIMNAYFMARESKQRGEDVASKRELRDAQIAYYNKQAEQAKIDAQREPIRQKQEYANQQARFFKNLLNGNTITDPKTMNDIRRQWLYYEAMSNYPNADDNTLNTMVNLYNKSDYVKVDNQSKQLSLLAKAISDMSSAELNEGKKRKLQETLNYVNQLQAVLASGKSDGKPLDDLSMGIVKIAGTYPYEMSSILKDLPVGSRPGFLGFGKKDVSYMDAANYWNASEVFSDPKARELAVSYLGGVEGPAAEALQNLFKTSFTRQYNENPNVIENLSGLFKEQPQSNLENVANALSEGYMNNEKEQQQPTNPSSASSDILDLARKNEGKTPPEGVSKNIWDTVSKVVAGKTVPEKTKDIVLDSKMSEEELIKKLYETPKQFDNVVNAYKREKNPDGTYTITLGEQPVEETKTLNTVNYLGFPQ